MTAIRALSEQIKARRRLPSPSARKALRTAAGVSQRDVARAVGVSTQTIWLWESGRAEPSDGHLSAYLRVLELFAENDSLETRSPAVAGEKGERDNADDEQSTAT